MNTWQIYDHHMLYVSKTEPLFPNKVKKKNIARSSCTNTTSQTHLNNSQIILKQLLLMVSLGGLRKFKQGQIFINNIPRGKNTNKPTPKLNEVYFASFLTFGICCGMHFSSRISWTSLMWPCRTWGRTCTTLQMTH